MQIEVHIPGAERIESLRTHIQGRLRSSIGESAGRVRRASVRLSEFWGPIRGSTWTSCRVEVDDESRPQAIVAEAYEPNPYRAVDNAIERLRLLLRQEATRPARTRPEDSDPPSSLPDPSDDSFDPAWSPGGAIGAPAEDRL